MKLWVEKHIGGLALYVEEPVYFDKKRASMGFPAWVVRDKKSNTDWWPFSDLSLYLSRFPVLPCMEYVLCEYKFTYSSVKLICVWIDPEYYDSYIKDGYVEEDFITPSKYWG